MTPTYKISAPARHAARMLLKNFQLSELGKIEATERNVAILIDVCTQAFRVEQVVDNLVRQVPWYDRNGLRENLDLLRDAVRAVELVRNRLPRYEKSHQVLKVDESQTESLIIRP